MEEIPHHPLILVSKEEMRSVRRTFDIEDIDRIKQSVQAILDWYNKQPHLVEKEISRGFVERIFLLSRGSVEASKQKLDRFCTLRTLTPELSMNRSIDEFKRFQQCVRYVPLPKLLPDQSRVMVTQFLTEELDEFSMLQYFRYCFLMGDYRLNIDYSLGESFIVDLKNVRAATISKLNPIVIKKAEILCTEGYGTKIMGIHILNAPSFVDKLVFILKQGLKEKVARRLHVHSNYDDLLEYVPKEVLPVDYGGEERSLEKLAAEWQDELSSKWARQCIERTDRLRVDENKRPSDKFNEEYLGMPGSFRKINID